MLLPVIGHRVFLEELLRLEDVVVVVVVVVERYKMCVYACLIVCI